MVHINDKAPDFDLINKDGNLVNFSSLRGEKVVLYFYPKDMTPGCTKQAEDFRDFLDQFAEVNTSIVGVSKDNMERHKIFTLKHSLPFILVSDENGQICEDYAVWVEKKNFGHVYMGIERSTFLIDEDGIIIKIWRKVRVKGHVDDVLSSVKRLF